MSFLKNGRRVAVVVALVLLVPTFHYLKVKYWGVELSPEEFVKESDFVGFADTLSSYRFDGIRDGRVYLSVWKMYGFPERFYYWVELDDLTPAQRHEIERRMAEENRTQESRGARKR